MKNMTITSIKATMKQLWIEYLRTGDNSYTEFWNALRTLKNLDHLSYETWKKVYEYDHWLFMNIDQVPEENEFEQLCEL